MIDYIRSSAVKKYLQENRIELDDKIKYALIHQCWYQYKIPYEEAAQSFIELAENSEDEEIKKQAAIRLRNWEKEWSAFVRDDGPNYFYRITDFYEECEYDTVRSFEHALNCGKESSIDHKDPKYNEKFFRIKKEYISQSEEEAKRIEEGLFIPARGEALFRAEGELVYCDMTIDLEEIDDPIEERFYILPHPFRRGDVVYQIQEDKDKQDRIYIIQSVEKDDIAEQESVWNRYKNFPLEWTDVTVSAFHIDIDHGTIWDCDYQVLPYELEYLDLEADKPLECNPSGDELKRELLLELSQLFKGQRASMQFIQNAFMKLREEYDNKDTCHLITGMILRKSSLGDM